MPTATPASYGFFHNLLNPPVGQFGVLDVIASLCAVGAAAAIVTMFFAPNLVSGKMATALGITAVGTWVIKIILVKFIWLVALLSIVGLVLFGMAFAYGHLAWIESKTGLDLNHDGKVG
jgi:hypothetical protein